MAFFTRAGFDAPAGVSFAFGNMNSMAKMPLKVLIKKNLQLPVKLQHTAQAKQAMRAR